jgi:hypothetical protein
MVRFDREERVRTRFDGIARRVRQIEVFVSRRPWASEPASALADDVCRR